MSLGYIFQLKDIFRDIPSNTSTGLKRHIMIIIAETDTDFLAVPIDSIENKILINGQLKLANYPQANDFKLNISEYGCSFIKKPSFVNYKKAKLIPRFNLQTLFNDSEIDFLGTIPDEFLTKLIDKGLSSQFLKPAYKQLLQ